MAASLELKSCVKIPDDFPGYDVDSFCLPPHYRDSVANVLIPHGQIQVRGWKRLTLNLGVRHIVLRGISKTCKLTEGCNKILRQPPRPFFLGPVYLQYSSPDWPIDPLFAVCGLLLSKKPTSLALRLYGTDRKS